MLYRRRKASDFSEVPSYLGIPTIRRFPMTDAPLTITAKELAHLLRVSVRTVQRATREQGIRHIRLGRVVRYPIDVLDELSGGSSSAPR
jgi:excisionase family DNA binding protein